MLTVLQIDDKIRDLQAELKLWRKLKRRLLAEQEVLAEIESKPKLGLVGKS